MEWTSLVRMYSVAVTILTTLLTGRLENLGMISGRGRDFSLVSLIHTHVKPT